MHIINKFNLSTNAKSEIFCKASMDDAIRYAALSYDEFSQYGHLTPLEITEFIDEFGTKDMILASRRKNKPGRLRQCFINDDGSLVTRNYIVRSSQKLGPHSEVIRDSTGNITHTLTNSQGKIQAYKWGNPLAIRADRVFLEGRAGTLQKFAMDLERPGLRRIAGLIFKLAGKIR